MIQFLLLTHCNTIFVRNSKAWCNPTTMSFPTIIKEHESEALTGHILLEYSCILTINPPPSNLI